MPFLRKDNIAEVAMYNTPRTTLKAYLPIPPLRVISETPRSSERNSKHWGQLFVYPEYSQTFSNDQTGVVSSDGELKPVPVPLGGSSATP
jgi:hypothetical protein